MARAAAGDRKSTRLNSSHLGISYAAFCLKKSKRGSVTARAPMAASWTPAPPSRARHLWAAEGAAGAQARAARGGRAEDCVLFFFNDTATTEIYTLSLHDALPI